MLPEILELQDNLNAKVGLSQEEALKMSTEERMKWIRKYCQALLVETSELLVEAGFKWWKDQEYNEANLKEEIIDIGHFFFSICLISGMDAKEIYDIYLGKNAKNTTREDWHQEKPTL